MREVAEPIAAAGDDGDAVREQPLEQGDCLRLRDDALRVGRLRLDHEVAQFRHPLGRHVRLELGHHLRDRHAVDVRRDLVP